MARKFRRPSHTFQLRSKPWSIQPFYIAPVLPGETMKNLLLQARVVTDPIKHPLVGWWSEFYFFYVKLRDLDIRDQITNMMLTNASTASIQTAAYANHYHGGGINFTNECYKRVVREYFREEDEPDDGWTGNVINGVWPAQLKPTQDWTDSLIAQSNLGEAQHELVGENPLIDPEAPAGFADAYAHWEAMRSMQLTAATFEDYLKSFGVKPATEAPEDTHRPELIRYIRDWSYPSNTVNAADGTPSSAVTWSVAERADKDRFFSEPGFIFGVTVCRPKVYYGQQTGSISHFMTDAFNWLPAVLQDQAYTSLKKFAAAGPGPLKVATEDYWVDIKDLLMYGDQFANFDLSAATDANSLTLPGGTFNKKYPNEAMADALFKGVNKLIRYDGRVDAAILSRVEDTSL